MRLKIDNKWVDWISEIDSLVSDPCFLTKEDLKYGIKTANSIAKPLFDSQNRIIAGFQIENKNKRGFPEKKIKISEIDQVLFEILTSMVQLKMDELLVKRDLIVKTNHLFDTLSLAARITTQRSYKALIREIKIMLPPYFEFGAVAILLFDTKTHHLFTISEVKKAEDAHGCEEYSDSGDVLSFPCNIGITGQVFETEEVYIWNNTENDQKFTSDIDNLTEIAEVYNFMIGPVYTSKKNSPVGVIQLINKHDKKCISEDDIEKFKIIQELLGRSISNTSEIHELINITIGLKSKLGNIKRLAANSAFE